MAETREQRLIRMARLTRELYDEVEYVTQFAEAVLDFFGESYEVRKDELPEQEICGTWIKKKEDTHG